MANKVNDYPVARELLPQTQKHPIDVSVTGMRLHEFALQRWFYRNFFVAEGFPIPVVFASPMDAYAEIQNLWKKDGAENPYAYLLQAKDANGTPLYEPYPAAIKYPIIGIKRLNWSPRINQSWGIHVNRKAWYASVVGENEYTENFTSSSGTMVRRELGNVAQVRLPTAWDFRFQVDHFCTYPETQAWFVNKVMRSFPYAGGSMQTWIPVVYPMHFGLEHRIVRLYIDGNIETPSTFEPDENQVDFRTSFTLVMEGYAPDIDVTMYPTLWTIRSSVCPATPTELDDFFIPPDTPCVEDEEDLRDSMANAVFNETEGLPKN